MYGGKPLVRDVQVRQLDLEGTTRGQYLDRQGLLGEKLTGPDFDAAQGSVAQEQLALYYQEVTWR